MSIVLRLQCRKQSRSRDRECRKGATITDFDIDTRSDVGNWHENGNSLRHEVIDDRKQKGICKSRKVARLMYINLAPRSPSRLRTLETKTSERVLFITSKLVASRPISAGLSMEIEIRCKCGRALLLTRKCTKKGIRTSDMGIKANTGSGDGVMRGRGHNRPRNQLPCQDLDCGDGHHYWYCEIALRCNEGALPVASGACADVAVLLAFTREGEGVVQKVSRQ